MIFIWALHPISLAFSYSLVSFHPPSFTSFPFSWTIPTGMWSLVPPTWGCRGHALTSPFPPPSLYFSPSLLWLACSILLHDFLLPNWQLFLKFLPWNLLQQSKWLVFVGESCDWYWPPWGVLGGGTVLFLDLWGGCKNTYLIIIHKAMSIK